MYTKRGLELGLIVGVVAFVVVVGLFFEGSITGAAIGLPVDNISELEENKLDFNVLEDNLLDLGIIIEEIPMEEPEVEIEMVPKIEVVEEVIEDEVELAVVPDQDIGVQAECTAWPCNCGDKVNASITLSGGLNGCGAIGLQIAKDNITINCVNNEINGTAKTGTQRGIYNQNYTNVTIANCQISGFTRLIDWENATSGYIVNNTLTNSSNGIYMTNSTNTIIHNNTFIDATDAIKVLSGNYYNITLNTFRNTTGQGIDFSDLDVNFTRIINNSFFNTSGGALAYSGFKYFHTIINNTIRDSTTVRIRDSVFNDNNLTGQIEFESPQNTTISRNRFFKGLFVDTIANGSNVSHNVVTTRFEIDIGADSIIVEHNVLNKTKFEFTGRHSTLYNNTIQHYNKSSGSAVSLYGLNNTFDSNLIQYSRSGILTSTATNTTFIHNNFTDNVNQFDYSTGKGINISYNTFSNITNPTFGALYVSGGTAEIGFNNFSVNSTSLYTINSNVTVKNNSVDGGVLGMYIRYPQHGKISFNTIKHTTTGIQFVTLTNASVTYNIIINTSRAFFNTFSLQNFVFNANYFAFNRLHGNDVGYLLDAPGIYDNQFHHEFVNSSSDGIRLAEGVGAFGFSSQNNTWYNSNFTNNTYDVNITGGGADIVFVNSTDNNNSYVPLISRHWIKWYTFVNVTDTNAQGLPNANVTGISATGSIEDTNVTDSSGLGRLVLTESYLEAGTRYFVTKNHTIRATRNGFNTNSSEADLILINSPRINLTLKNITCGTPIKTSFTLATNLSTTGNCLLVAVDNITINGAGYAVIGTGTGMGINITGKQGIKIENITFENFTRSVYLEGTKNSIFRFVTTRNTSFAFIFNNSNNNTIYDSPLDNATLGNVVVTDNGASNISLVNVTISPQNVSAGSVSSVFVKWYVKVNATYNGNLTLPNGNASGFFNVSNGKLDDSLYTDDNGFANLELTELEINSSGVTYLTPHNITLSYTSSSTATSNFTSLNLTKTNNTLISLGIKLNCTSPSPNLNASGNTTFCPGRFTVYNMTIGTFKSNLTCDGTTLVGTGSSVGLTVLSNNISINKCSFENHRIAIDVPGPTDYINITNSDFSTCGSSILDYLHTCIRVSGDYPDIRNNTMSSGTKGLRLNETVGGTILFNNFTNLTVGIHSDSSSTIVHNNSFSLNTYSLSVKPGATNVYYHNDISSVSSNVISSNTSAVLDDYNNTIGGKFQGNKWDDYCDKGKDTNNDGYADAASNAGSGDYPYNTATSNKILELKGARVIDYHPLIHTCVTTVFLGSSSSSSSSSSEEGGGSALPAPAENEVPVQEEAPAESYGSVAEVAENLETNIIVEDLDEKIVNVKVTLENTGTKTMKLFPKILQDVDDPFFIVTKKTLGFAGSLFSKLSFIWYSGDTISGRLLEAEIVDPGQIVLEPGQKIEKEIQIKEGLSIPRKIKIQFTTFGETILEEDISDQFNSREKAVSGTAVDVDKENSLIDIYAVIFPPQLSEAFEKSLNENSITGAAVANIKENSNTYFLELNVNSKKETKQVSLPGKFSLVQKYLEWNVKTGLFTDIYGPYVIDKDQALVFAQQLEYNKELCEEDYEITAKIYRESEIVVENEFEVELC